MHVRGIKVCLRMRGCDTSTSVLGRCAVLYCLRWLRACRGAWTGRCRSGSCLCWGSAAWPASSPGRRSGSASYSGPARSAFAAGGGTGSSPLSPRWEQRKEGRL